MHTPPIVLPDVHDFAALLEYRGEWDHGHRPDVAPRILGDERRRDHRDDVGPFCTFENVDGHPRRSLAVTATDLTMAALRGRTFESGDTLSFKVYGRPEGRALVVASHNQIIASHWLAYVDAATLPAYPYALRDERAKGISDAIRAAGGSPYRHRSDEPHAVTLSDGHDGLRATVHPAGDVERQRPDGSVSHEPAR